MNTRIYTYETESAGYWCVEAFDIPFRLSSTDYQCLIESMNRFGYLMPKLRMLILKFYK